MNITDFIVVYLQQGKSVEIPSVGTLSIVGQQIVLRQSFNNDKAIVKYIAEKECVSDSIAEMMWKNYVDALTDKLKRSGSHEFKGIGVMTYNNGVYGFTASTGTTSVENVIESQVVGTVKKYTKSDDEDPFNAFEQPIDNNIIGSYGAKVGDEQQYEKQPISNDLTSNQPIEHVQLEQKEEVIEKVEEPIERVEVTLQPSIEKVVGKDTKPTPLNYEPIEEAKSEDNKEPIEEVKTVAENRVEHEVKEQEEIKDPIISKEEESPRAKMEELDAMPNIPQEKEVKKKGRKKKNRVWLWIIIILLLLCIGGGAYLYFTKYSKNAYKVGDASMVDVNRFSKENDFTYNLDLIEFSEESRTDEVYKVCDFMEDYIYNFILSRGYGYAKDQMMERVEQYVRARIDTLLSVDKYAVRRYIPYEDYIYNECLPTLTRQKAQGARVEIQIELMELSIIEDLLHSMIIDFNLESEFKAVKKVVEPEYVAPQVTMVKKSKQGYDIIAGFYTSRVSATRMTYVLKNQGCDAYVVEKNNGYYVSMGSAGTQTAAEALLKHIKSWYDGDAVIKKID